MSSPAPSMLDNLTLNVTQEIHVSASLETTFAALLEQLGPYNEVGEDKPMPMVIEAWPGGRWFRDLGTGDGHYWGTCRRSRNRPCSKFAARSSCPIRWPTIFNTA